MTGPAMLDVAGGHRRSRGDDQLGRRIGFGWITWIGRFPPILWALERGYVYMARHRPLFARWLFRSETRGPFAPPDPK